MQGIQDNDDAEDEEDEEEFEQRWRKKPRRGGEMGRDWVCEREGCTKDFKSVSNAPPACFVHIPGSFIRSC